LLEQAVSVADTTSCISLSEHFASHPSRKKREQDGTPSVLAMPARSRTKAGSPAG
jgi:hypothetical protein